MPQLVPSQVAKPLGSVAHALQLDPQVAVEKSETHCPAQRCVPPLQAVIVHWLPEHA